MKHTLLENIENIDQGAQPIYLIVEPVDMRLGVEGLSACVQHRMRRTPCAGGLYLFSNARRNRLKLLLWDATGVWLAQRRLHKGRFTWIDAASATSAATGVTEPHTEVRYTLTRETFGWLTQGVDWQRLIARTEAQAHWAVA